jgi:hypothetical protein
MDGMNADAENAEDEESFYPYLGVSCSSEVEFLQSKKGCGVMMPAFRTPI